MNKKSPMHVCGMSQCGKREMIRVLKMQDNTFVLTRQVTKTAAGTYLCKRWSVWIRSESRIGTFVQNEYTKRNYCGIDRGDENDCKITGFYQVWGLLQKAGCIASGEFAVEKAVKGGGNVVIVAEDA